MGRLSTGSIHGRFQPFHNGHLDYVLQAFERAEFIKVGLTQIFRPSGASSASRRDNAEANPLAYWERAFLVATAIEESGISRSRFEFVPFPIEEPKQLTQFIAPSVHCFTTVLSDWNEEKIERLEAQGYSVSRLQVSPPDVNRVSTGTEIRRLIRSRDHSWEKYVPPSVSKAIIERFFERF